VEPIRLEFTSPLSATPAQVWDWIRSVRGVTAEMRPLFRMGFPAGALVLDDGEIELGKPLFRSPLYLLGLIPVGHSDVSFSSWSPGLGFVEQSAMTGMRSWRHERTITPIARGCALTDVLKFEPVFARRLTRMMIRRFFKHRHAVLRKRLG